MPQLRHRCFEPVSDGVNNHQRHRLPRISRLFIFANVKLAHLSAVQYEDEIHGEN